MKHANNAAMQKAIAVLLAGLPEADRTSVCREASADARAISRNLPEGTYTTALAQLIPAHLSPEQTLALMNDYGIQLCSLASSPGDASVAQVIALANRIQAGENFDSANNLVPMAADPTEPSQEATVPYGVAVASLASTLGPDAINSPSIAQYVKDASSIQALYDCGFHHGVLGAEGDVPLAGGLLSKWKEKRAEKKAAKEAAKSGQSGETSGQEKSSLLAKIGSGLGAALGLTQAATDAATQVSDNLGVTGSGLFHKTTASEILSQAFPDYVTMVSKKSNDQAKAAAAANIAPLEAKYVKAGGEGSIWDGLANMYTTVFGDRSGDKTVDGDVVSELQQLMDSASESVKDALKDLDSLSRQQSEIKDTAAKSQRNVARLLWAQAALNAGDEAADVMTLTSPDFGTAEKLISSSLGTLPAAKQLGTSSSWKALMQAIKAAFARADVSTSVIPQLMGSGDPDDTFAGCPAGVVAIDRYQPATAIDGSATFETEVEAAEPTAPSPEE